MSRWNFGELTKHRPSNGLQPARCRQGHNPMIDMLPCQGWLTFGYGSACPDTCEKGDSVDATVAASEVTRPQSSPVIRPRHRTRIECLLDESFSPQVATTVQREGICMLLVSLTTCYRLTVNRLSISSVAKLRRPLGRDSRVVYSCHSRALTAVVRSNLKWSLRSSISSRRFGTAVSNRRIRRTIG